MAIAQLHFPLTADDVAELNARLGALQARCDALVTALQAQAAGIPTVVGPLPAVTISGDSAANIASGLIFTNQTVTAGSSTGTLTNAPAGTNPTVWLRVNVNGTVRQFPGW